MIQTKKYAPQILKISSVFTRVLEIASYIIVGLAVLVGVVFLLIPADSLMVSLSELDNVSITIEQISISISSLGVSGDITLKWVVVLGSLFVAGSLGLLSVILYHLRKIVYEVKEGEPFSPMNATRLYKMGFVTIIASIVVPLLGLFVQSYVIHLIGFDDATVNYMINVTYLFVGFLMVVLASVFEQGAYLQSEYDQTV